MRSAFAALAFLTGLPVAAQDSDLRGALGNCMAIEARLDRLDCFDAIGPTFGLSVAQSAWRVERRAGTLDSLPDISVTLEASRGRAAFDRPILLIARCRNDRTEVYLHWNQFLGQDGGTLPDLWKNVTLQLDDSEPESGEWPLSDVQEATFTPEWGGRLLRRLADADRFFARVVPYDGVPLEAEFALDGASDAIRPLAEACGWALEP